MPSNIVQEAFNNKRGVFLINGSTINGTPLPATTTIDPLVPTSYVKVWEANYGPIAVTNATTSGSTVSFTITSTTPIVPVGTQIEVKGLVPTFYNGLWTVLTSSATTLTAAANQLSVTAASGDGTTATLTFTRTIPIIPVGTTITVAGLTGGASGYNDTATVTASTATSVSYVNATNAAAAGTGTITLTSSMTTNYPGSFSSFGPQGFRIWTLFNDSSNWMYVRLNSLNTVSDSNYFMVKAGENFSDQIDGTAIWIKSSSTSATSDYRLELSGIPVRRAAWRANSQEVITAIGSF